MRTLTRYLAIFFLVIFLGSCSDREKPMIRIGTNFWPGYDWLYVARDKGFYEKEGLDVKLVELTSLADVRRAFERNQVDGFTGTLIELLQSRDKSKRTPQVVFLTDYSNGADCIISQSSIADVKGLKGKRVALELGTLNVYLLGRALESIGSSLDEVTLVAMDQLSMEGAFLNHEVDAVVTYPPVSVNILSKSNAKKIFSSANVPGEIVDIVAFDSQFIANHKEDLKRLIRVFKRTMHYVTDHQAEAYRIMAAHERLSVEQFEATIKDGVKLLTLEEQLELMKPNGSLTKAVTLTDKVLRQLKEISGPDSTADIYSFEMAREVALED